MRHIHTSIVSRHLATTGNNKILRTPPPHTSSSASLVAPLPNSEQINHPSSNHTYTKSTLNHIHHHCVPSATPTHTTHTISSTAPTYAPHCHPWIWWTDPCWPDRRRSWLVDHKRREPTPLTNKGQGSG